MFTSGECSGALGPAIQANLTDVCILAVGNLILQFSFLSLPLSSTVILFNPLCRLRLSRALPGYQDGYNYLHKWKCGRWI